MLGEMMKDVKLEPWDEALVARVDAERRNVMPQEQHAEREAWRAADEWMRDLRANVRR